jgi:hypothetical protein
VDQRRRNPRGLRRHSHVITVLPAGARDFPGRLIAALRGFKGATVKKRRRLSDLYIRGKEVKIDDGTGDPVVIWVQKLNEIERDTVLRRANAAKARYLLECEHEESELFVSTFASVHDYLDHDATIDTIISEDLINARQRFEAQMTADENGWGKDDKIRRLLDEWVGTDDEPGLAAKFAEDENDPAALKVKAELEAYDAELEAAVKDERDRLARAYDDTPDMELNRFATREVLKRRGDEVFMKEWMRQQTFHCVREPDDHQKRYFSTLAEVDDLHDTVREALERQCNSLFVDLAEGKDSPASPASSTSSEPTPEAEASEPSGPVAVSA